MEARIPGVSGDYEFSADQKRPAFDLALVLCAVLVADARAHPRDRRAATRQTPALHGGQRAFGAVLTLRASCANLPSMSVTGWVGCVNFRDVGEWITLIAGREYLPNGRLLRGGKLDSVRDAGEIGSPRTILNLRMGDDRETFGAAYRHVAISNAYEKYNTTDRMVRRWLNAVAAAVCDAPALPVLLHCASGKDRTGVAVAVLLRALRVPQDVIVEEYLLSDGGVERAWITGALEGVGAVEAHLDRVDLQRLRLRLTDA
jgi:protein-tyrosine phosphatase